MGGAGLTISQARELSLQDIAGLLILETAGIPSPTSQLLEQAVGVDTGWREGAEKRREGAVGWRQGAEGRREGQRRGGRGHGRREGAGQTCRGAGGLPSVGTVPGSWALAPPSTVEEAEAQRAGVLP